MRYNDTSIICNDKGKEETIFIGFPSSQHPAVSGKASVYSAHAIFKLLVSVSAADFNVYSSV